jgi:hypothetical protein
MTVPDPPVSLRQNVPYTPDVNGSQVVADVRRAGKQIGHYALMPW